MADPTVQGQIQALLATISALPHVTRVESPLDSPNQVNTSDIVPNGDGTVSIATVHFDSTAAELPKAEMKA